MKTTGKDKRRKRNPTDGAPYSTLWTPAQLAAALKKWGRPEGQTREMLAAILKRSKHLKR